MSTRPPADATICVTTYRRPVGLARLLDALAHLEVPAGWSFDVVVVDNDPDASARPVVEAAPERGGMAARYVHEPERGIAQVRNRALRECASAPWIAFLDDDEWPEPSWWRRLVEVQSRTGADVVLGPSEPVFEEEPPAWIREGGFFERDRFPTGTQILFWQARTSGVIVRRAAFEHLGPKPFDERYSLAGGEDVRFFELLERNGALIVWADDAIVKELVPASRSNTRWILRRAFRTGNSRSVTLLVEGAGPALRARRVVRGLLDCTTGLARAVASRSKAARMRGVALGALGLGLIAGALGVRYNEYVVTHGR